MEKKERIQWGIIGTARIAANSIIPAIKASRNGKIYAIASRTENKARDFATRHGIEKFYGSYEKLLEDKNIDAIYLPLPTGMHYEWALKCAEAGKPVLCEKPLTDNYVHSVKLAQVFANKGILLAEALMFRYHPMTQKVHEIVKSGMLGAPRMLYAQFNAPIRNLDDYRFDLSLGGGSLLDLGSYCVSAMRLLAECEPEDVSARAVFNERGVDIRLVGELQFPNGALGHFGCGFDTQFDCSYGASGSLGRVFVGWGGMCAWPGTQFKIEIWTGESRSEIIVPPANHYQLLVEDFADALLNNRPPLHNIEDSLANMKIVEKLLESARSKAHVN